MKCSWRGGWGTKALQLESSKQLLWGFAPAAHQAVFTSKRKQASLSLFLCLVSFHTAHKCKN